MSALPPKADMLNIGADVCFVPLTDIGSTLDPRKNAQLGQILTLTQVKALTAMMLTLEALDRYSCRADLAKRMGTKRLAKRDPDVKQAPLR
jgi:hypothetical protein